MVALLGRQIDELDARIKDIDAKLTAAHKANEVSQRLVTIPGVGPVTALTLAVEIDPATFESGRHLAAWAGLTPKEHSTGGKQRMGGISRAGNERLRVLLVSGATSVINAAMRPGSEQMTDWLRALLQRKPRKVVAVALANKMARVAWALMTRGEVYRPARGNGSRRSMTDVPSRNNSERRPRRGRLAVIEQRDGPDGMGHDDARGGRRHQPVTAGTARRCRGERAE